MNGFTKSISASIFILLLVSSCSFPGKHSTVGKYKGKNSFLQLKTDSSYTYEYVEAIRNPANPSEVEMQTKNANWGKWNFTGDTLILHILNFNGIGINDDEQIKNALALPIWEARFLVKGKRLFRIDLITKALSEEYLEKEN
jgi:hypothetical protein